MGNTITQHREPIYLESSKSRKSLFEPSVMPKRLTLAPSRAKGLHSITKDPFHSLLNILHLDLAQASFVINKLMGLCKVHRLFTLKKKTKPNQTYFYLYSIELPYELTVKTKPPSKLMIFHPFREASTRWNPI